MKFYKLILTSILVMVSYQVALSQVHSIRTVDFRNFTFPATYREGSRLDAFALKNGQVNLSKELHFFLQSISYDSINLGEDDDDDIALVAVRRDDGGATYHTLYVYHMKKGRPKLLASFEFGDGLNIHLAAAFVAHGELVIERYIQETADSECCPSVIEISYYKWKKDKFVLLDEPQRVPNGYVERQKKKNEKN